MEVEDDEDHYTLLGLPTGEEGTKLNIKEIEKAYRSKARSCHPDKNPNDPLAKSTFQKLQYSYEILRNDTTRKAFDDLIRAKVDRRRRESLFDTKRRKMMSDLERRERAADKAREEEEIAAKKFREEVERIRAMCAKKMEEMGSGVSDFVSVGAATGASVGESVRNVGNLDKERMLKVSWEKDGEDYSLERLKELFMRFGEVEDVVMRRRSKNRKNALLVMASKEAAAAAVAATQILCGDLANPLLVVPFHSTATDSSAASVGKHVEPDPSNLSNLVGASYQAYEDSVLKKLQKLYVPPHTMAPQSQEGFEQNNMLPSPIHFQTREELLEHARNFGKDQGYMITIKRSQKDKRVTLGCDRGGVRRSRKSSSANHRQRKIGSRLINCPFKMEGRKKTDGSWVLKIKNGEHNHEALEDMSCHPFNRRFSEEEVLHIKEMIAAGVQPREMLTTLKQNNPNLLAMSRDVYNIKKKIRQENLSGRSTIQALLDELARGGFQYNLKYDGEGHLTHLFFAHPNSIAMSKSYSNVFIMDCTCKTNKYKMTLLDVVGVTSFNTSFISCFAFLGKEEEEDYVWALKMFDTILGINSRPTVILSDGELSLRRAIHVVFPGVVNLLCIWHVEKSIWSNCRPHFKVGENWDGFLSSWNKLINSPTEIAYYEAWQAFQVAFQEKLIVLNYIANSWLPLKEHFVKAWTERHFHFGHRVTSSAQGVHAKLKKYVRLSTSDLNLVKTKICLAIDNQLQKFHTQLSTDKIQVPQKLCIPFFDELVSHISVFALRELFKQYRLATCNPTLSVCTNQFTATMGLPCAHKMRFRIYESEVLHLGDIHPQWQIDYRALSNIDVEINSLEDRMTEMPMLHNKPDVQDPEESPLRSKTSTTIREASTFEIMEKARKCSLCKGIGHNSRTCQRKGVATMPGSHFPLPISNGSGSAVAMQNLNMLSDGNIFMCD
ncbi:PKS-NRPS hybrid synthetase cheA-like [Tasmannia lanceolata]|uniref:PKS-NRPS hybrid synthetase cheA-like n=1 Tax=Tasmannia lanceolata TaxID=3420 RepID=UPI0040640EB5